MPSKKMLIQFLEDEVRKGRGDDPCHLVDIKKEQAERIKNDGPRPKTKFVIETDSPEMYSAMNLEKDRIITRAKNKSVALSLMLTAWQWMSDPMIDKVLAETEGPPV